MSLPPTPGPLLKPSSLAASSSNKLQLIQQLSAELSLPQNPALRSFPSTTHSPGGYSPGVPPPILLFVILNHLCILHLCNFLVDSCSPLDCEFYEDRDWVCLGPSYVPSAQHRAWHRVDAQ